MHDDNARDLDFMARAPSSHLLGGVHLASSRRQ